MNSSITDGAGRRGQGKSNKILMPAKAVGPRQF